MSLKLIFSSAIISLQLAAGAANASVAKEPDKECVEWFKRSNVKPGSQDCEITCSTLITDMGTFTCPDQCEILCKPKEDESLLSKFVLYPGLTQAEKELVANNPKQAYAVYKLKGAAEDSTDRNFPNQDLNDESDAFRHFVWSGLLTMELGRKKAKEYLDAHEANPLQSDREKQMDLFNNERGQSTAESLVNSKKWSQNALELKALEELRSKHLDVMVPGLDIPKEPK